MGTPKSETMATGAELAAVTKMLEDAYAQLAPIATEALGHASRDLAAFPIEIQAKLLTLMRTGWAVDPDQPIVFVRLAQGEFGDTDEAEGWIARHFESRLDEIQAALAHRHAERAAILGAAFDAHRRGLYTLSVPVFLAQADGIVGDRYPRKQLFAKGQHGLSSQLNEMEQGQLSTMWAEIFSGKAEVSTNVRDLPRGFDGLNRHAVLHGADLNYGTHWNSLKAVSMLFMSSHLVASNPSPDPSTNDQRSRLDGSVSGDQSCRH